MTGKKVSPNHTKKMMNKSNAILVNAYQNKEN